MDDNQITPNLHKKKSSKITILLHEAEEITRGTLSAYCNKMPALLTHLEIAMRVLFF